MQLVQLNLFVNNEIFTLDLSNQPDLVPKIFKRTADPTKLQNAVGDYSLNLKLPRTVVNNSLAIKFSDDLQKARGFLDIPLFRAQILVNSSNVLEGNFYIDRITPEVIEATIVGDNIAWKDLFTSQSLKELNFLPTLPFTGFRGSNLLPWPANAPNTVSIGQFQFNTNRDRFINWALISYGNFQTSSQTINPTNGLPTIEAQGLIESAIIIRDGRRPFHWEELTPVFYLKEIIRRLFKSIDFNVAGDWFNDPTTDNLIFPFYGSLQQLYDGYNWALFGQCLAIGANLLDFRFINIPNSALNVAHIGLPVDPTARQIGLIQWTPITVEYDYSLALSHDLFYTYTEVSGVIVINQNNRLTNSGYAVKSTGLYAVTFSMELSNIGPFILNFDLGLALVVNPANTLPLNGYFSPSFLPLTDNVKVVNTFNYVSPGPIQLTVSAELELQAGDILTPIMAFDQTGLPLNLLRFKIIEFSVMPAAKVAIEPSAGFNANRFDFNLRPENFLPTISPSDLIKSVIEIFNLYPQVDIQYKLISFNYLSSVTLPPSAAIDWSAKCSLTEATIEPVTAFKEVVFEWPAISDEINQAADLNFRYLNPIKGFTEVKNIKPIFGPAFSRQYNYITTVQTNPLVPVPVANVDIPTIAQVKSLNISKGDLAIAFDSWARDLGPIRLLEWTDNQPTGLTYLVGRLLINTYLINYTPVANLPIPKIWADQNWQILFNKYYRNLLTKTTNEILIQMPVYLTEVDLQNLDLRRPIIVNGILLKLIEIAGFDPVNPKPTICKFIKL
jgi:hypothetical protein